MCVKFKQPSTSKTVRCACFENKAVATIVTFKIKFNNGYIPLNLRFTFLI